jgi:D-proline reductase (dithiol) PrdB
MVRISDIDPGSAKHLLGKECPPFETAPWVTGPPVTERRVAVVTSAGLHRRVISGDINTSDLVMTQSSANFDRTGFQQDVNVVFPIDRLRELRDAGEVGEIADYHYAINGAGWLPHQIEATAREMAGLLKEDRVNAVLLVPV